MKTILLLICCITVIFLATSCDQVEGQGPVITSTRNINGFKAIESTMSANTEITIGPAYSVKVEAQQNLQKLVVTEVEGDRLVIKTKNDVNINTDHEIVIHITMPELNSLDVTGSGNAKILNDITGKSLHLDVSGSGDLETASIHTESLDASLTGSGNIHIAGGECQEGRFSLTGNGDADAGNLMVKQMTADLTGSGNASVNVSEYLKVSVTGSGDINYKGNAQVSAEVTGSGSVHKSM